MIRRLQGEDDAAQRFIPPPHFSEVERLKEVGGPGVFPIESRFGELGEKCPFSGESWLVYLMYTEAFGRFKYPLHLPTAADCLLWIRWWLLPSYCSGDGVDFCRPQSIALFGEPAEIAADIDALPAGTPAEKILRQFARRVCGCKNEVNQIDLYSITTIHEWMTRTYP